MRVRHIPSIAFAFLMILGASAQVSQTPTNLPQVTPPGPQRPSPQGGGRQPLASPIDRSPGTVPNLQLPKGVVTGYVFWDSSTSTSILKSPCLFVVRINKGTLPSGGAVGFEQFTEIGTYQNSFTSLGKVGQYTVCQYAVNHLPEGVDLQVQIAPVKGTQQTAVVFTIPPTANDPNKPIRLNGGQCNQLPPSVPSVSTLGSAWWTCGDYAYNVNYLMQPPQNIPGLTQPPGTLTVVQPQTLLPSSGAPDEMIKPGPQ